MTRWRPIATTLVCLVGLGLAAFLTYSHYFDQQALNSCPLSQQSGAVDCIKVTGSPQSIIFGLPVAIYGLGYFVVMLGLCVPRVWRSTSQRIAQVRLTLSVIGMGFVIYLISVEALQVHAICIYCTGVHLMQFALFLLVVTGWYDTGWATRDDYDDGEYADGADDPELVEV